jgi:general secretion pathway protein F
MAERGDQEAVTAYRYWAARADGVMVRGVVDAATAGDAGVVLTERGLFPVAFVPVEASEVGHRTASRRDLAIVFRSLAALGSAGVPLERALAASEALARGVLRDLLGTARARLREGQGLAQALSAGRGLVPDIVLGMIRAGERSSQLGAALEQVATHLEQEAELVARVRQALAYPLLLAVVGMASVLIIATVVVPRFAELLGDLGQDLPVATQVLLAGSALVSRFWFLAVPIGLMVIWGVRETLQRPSSRRGVDELLLMIPVLGALRLALASARIARALGSMLRAGMPLLAALAAAGEAAGDAAIAERLHRARERVARGEPVTTSLGREAALTQSALQLVAVGESSGRLGEMTCRAGDLAAQEAERGLKTLVTLVEPALIIGFGAMVAFVAAALLQAVYSLRPGGL